MPKITKLERTRRNYLRAHKRCLRDALTVQGREPTLDDINWFAFTTAIAQLVTDVGKDDAASILETVAAKIRSGLYRDYDGTQLSQFSGDDVDPETLKAH